MTKERKHICKVLEEQFKEDRKIAFAYLFGSSARGDEGPLSDVDIAVYLTQEKDQLVMRTKLMEKVAKTLGTDRIDVIVLNDATPVLGFAVVKDGILLKEDSSRRIEYESRVISEYLDNAYLWNVHRRNMQEQIARGEYFGK